MSFKISFPRKDRVAARFLSQVHTVLAHAAIEAKSERRISQRRIAEQLGVDKAVVSRIFKGTGNPTARTIGEVAAALGYRPELILHRLEKSGNEPSSIEIEVGDHHKSTHSNKNTTVFWKPILSTKSGMNAPILESKANE